MEDWFGFQHGIGGTGASLIIGLSVVLLRTKSGPWLFLGEDSVYPDFFVLDDFMIL